LAEIRPKSGQKLAFWSILANFGQNHGFSPILAKIIDFDQKSSILVIFGQFWPILANFGQNGQSWGRKPG
jgi:hypothetical protein